MKTFKKLAVSATSSDFYNKYATIYDVITMPQGFEKFTLDGEPRKIRLNILPYTIDIITPAIKNLEKDDIGKGDLHYEASFWMHRNVGVDNAAVICPLKTAAKPCPICEYRVALRNNGADKEEYKPYFPQHRQLWAVEVDGADKNPYLWDVSNYMFGKRLMEHLNMVHEDNPDVLYFADPVKGTSVLISVDKGSFTKSGGGHINEVKSLTLVPRKVPVSEASVDMVPDLNSLFIIKSYDEIKEMFQPSESPVEDEPYTVAGTEEITSSFKEEDDDTPPFKVEEKTEIVNESSFDRCQYGKKFGEFNRHDEACISCDIFVECNTARQGK